MVLMVGGAPTARYMCCTHTHTHTHTPHTCTHTPTHTHLHAHTHAHTQSLEEMMASLRCELRGQEIRIRQEVCREFNEQLIEIEESHRLVRRLHLTSHSGIECTRVLCLSLSISCPCSRELETQAEEIEELYEKRMKNLQKSMKRQYTRKRRRREDDEGEG